MGHSPFFQSPTNHYPIMPTVTLKSDTYHRLETLVTPPEDTPESVVQRLAWSLQELNEPYAMPLPKIEQQMDELSENVRKHLETMGVRN